MPTNWTTIYHHHTQDLIPGTNQEFTLVLDVKVSSNAFGYEYGGTTIANSKHIYDDGSYSIEMALRRLEDDEGPVHTPFLIQAALDYVEDHYEYLQDKISEYEGLFDEND